MQKIRLRLKARMGRGLLRPDVIVILARNNKWIRAVSLKSVIRKFPELAKKIKAANGKCIELEITIKVVKK